MTLLFQNIYKKNTKVNIDKADLCSSKKVLFQILNF